MTVSKSPSPPLAVPVAIEEGPPHEKRNFWILVTYQVVLRAGWIFKTESVVMPHAADALAHLRFRSLANPPAHFPEIGLESRRFAENRHKLRLAGRGEITLGQAVETSAGVRRLSSR